MIATPQVFKHLREGGCGGDICRACDGKGWITWRDSARQVNVSEDCSACQGTGMR